LTLSLTLTQSLTVARLAAQDVRPPLWTVRESAFQGIRTGVPAIVNLLAQSMYVTRDWQFYIRAINRGMTRQHVSAIFEYQKAFCNGTGFGDSNDPRRDYILNENLNAKEEPQFDKVRTCVRSTHTGAANDTVLRLLTMDGNQPPPMKLSKRHPQTLDEIRLEDYLYTPKTHRWLFFAANNIGSGGQVTAFAGGAVYEWFGDRQVTWLPLVSRYPVSIALQYVRKLGADEAIPSPYTG